MQKQKKTLTGYGIYGITAGIILTYLIFPTPYITLSQKIFIPIYKHTAPELPQNKKGRQKTDTTKLYVLAQPPQTPYDFLILTDPKRGATKENLNNRYIYSETNTPIGRIHKQRQAIYIAMLFSSPESREMFSVGKHVSQGVGTGNGGFFIQTPIDKTIEKGDSILHQATGTIVSEVIAIEEMIEKNVQRVVGTINSNPLETALVYVPKERPKAISEKEIQEATKEIAIIQEKDETPVPEKNEKENPENQNTETP